MLRRRCLGALTAFSVLLILLRLARDADPAQSRAGVVAEEIPVQQRRHVSSTVAEAGPAVTPARLKGQRRRRPGGDCLRACSRLPLS